MKIERKQFESTKNTTVLNDVLIQRFLNDGTHNKINLFLIKIMMKIIILFSLTSIISSNSQVLKLIILEWMRANQSDHLIPSIILSKKKMYKNFFRTFQIDCQIFILDCLVEVVHFKYRVILFASPLLLPVVIDLLHF